MCVCVYVGNRVCVRVLHVCVSTGVACVCICMSHMQRHVCVSVFVRACSFVCLCVFMCVCRQLCVRTCEYVCACVCLGVSFLWYPVCVCDAVCLAVCMCACAHVRTSVPDRERVREVLCAYATLRM